MKLAVATLALLLAFGMLLFAADSKTVSSTGWITDERCAAMHGGGTEHAACARKCIEHGMAAVFVGDQDKKIMKVANQEAVKKYAGEHVKLEGTVDEGGMLHVDKVATLAESK